MEEYLNYFEEYYKKNYEAFDFYHDDTTFSCHFPEERKNSKPFTLRLLSERAYHIMHHFGVLDRYLEMHKIRTSDCMRDRLNREYPLKFAFYEVQDCMVDRMDEWLPYVGDNRFADCMVKLSDFTLIFTIKGRKGHRTIYVYDGDLYNPKNRVHVEYIPYCNEISIADDILGLD